MLIEFECGIDPRRLEDWLEGESLPEGCDVTLSRLAPVEHGPIVLPRTTVRMEGPDQAIEGVHQRFFLRFMSAGG